MLRVRANVFFPVPAAFAFLVPSALPTTMSSVGSPLAGATCRLQVARRSAVRGAHARCVFASVSSGSAAGQRDLRFERFADGLRLTFLFEAGQNEFAQLEQSFPRAAFGFGTLQRAGLPRSRDAPKGRPALPGMNSHASSAVKTRIGESISHRPVTRCDGVRSASSGGAVNSRGRCSSGLS